MENPERVVGNLAGMSLEELPDQGKPVGKKPKILKTTRCTRATAKISSDKEIKFRLIHMKKRKTVNLNYRWSQLNYNSNKIENSNEVKSKIGVNQTLVIIAIFSYTHAGTSV